MNTDTTIDSFVTEKVVESKGEEFGFIYATLTILALVVTVITAYGFHKLQKENLLYSQMIQAQHEQIVQLKFDLDISKREQARLQLAVNNALVPEATWREAARNHVYTPVATKARNAANVTGNFFSNSWSSFKNMIGLHAEVEVTPLHE